MSWLEGWQYRKSHEIEGSTAGAVTDYQIRIAVHYGSGTDSGEHVYLDGKCRTDFGDIRFTDSDGVTELSYWIEDKIDGDYAIFWVKVSNIPASPDSVTIYIYYGNPSVTTVSNFANTFHFTEDWEACNLDGWSGNKSYKSCSGEQPKRGTYSLKVYTTSTSYGIYTMYKDYSGLANQKYVFDLRWIRLVGDIFYGIRVRSADKDIVLFGAKASTSQWVAYDGKTAIYWGNIITGQYYKIEFRIKSDKTYDIYINDVLQQSGLAWFDDTAGDPNRAVFMSQSGSVNSRYYSDDLRILKYIDPEPSHGTWGSEEVPIIYKISGYTRDANGDPLPNCTVWLFRTSDKQFIAETISDEDGYYEFTVYDNVTEYFIRAHKDGTPNVFGTTDRNLKGVAS